MRGAREKREIAPDYGLRLQLYGTLSGSGLALNHLFCLGSQGVGEYPTTPIPAEIPILQFRQLRLDDLGAVLQGGTRSLELFGVILSHRQNRVGLSAGRGRRILGCLHGPIRRPVPMSLSVFR